MYKSKAKQKLIERWFLEEARGINTVIPDGAISESEEPDFTLATSRGNVGIEVTELIRRDHSGPFLPVEEAEFHRDVVQLAEERYIQSTAEPAGSPYFLRTIGKFAAKHEPFPRFFATLSWPTTRARRRSPSKKRRKASI